MNNEAINDLLKTTKQLEGKIDEILKLQQTAINSLPEEERVKLAFVDRDVQDMKKALHERDLSKIQTYLDKYASHSTKH